MARASKLARFAEMRSFPHVFEPPGRSLLTTDYKLKGSWRDHFFKNDHPLVLELGCGKGEYTLELARRNPDMNYIGVDIKGSRMWKGARQAMYESLANVAFLRMRIEFITRAFAPEEVDEIWITFPDPQPKKLKKRLTSSGFLNFYQQILKSGSRIHLKTDSMMLHKYTLEILKANQVQPDMATDDLYNKAQPTEDSDLQIQTFYESRFLEKQKPITYTRFVLPNSPLYEPDE